ncbi:MAG: hypothetical protein Q8L99_04110 [Polycyclovorans sp.]|jgi:hypothetical protein|nr:hypothetical protein [Alphaproteobacteria bacterium]MDP1542314.1 hypothetical protein [Polycyclovorans sp.]
MTLESPFHRPWLLTLLCVMLLVARVGGAHLHLCFDGGEPPANLHLMDSGLHHSEPGMTADHHDVDVAVVGEVLAKVAKLGLDLPILLLMAVLVWSLFQAPSKVAYEFRNLFSPSAARSLRPPLRGPPQLISPLMN